MLECCGCIREKKSRPSSDVAGTGRVVASGALAITICQPETGYQFYGPMTEWKDGDFPPLEGTAVKFDIDSSRTSGTNFFGPRFYAVNIRRVTPRL